MVASNMDGLQFGHNNLELYKDINKYGQHCVAVLSGSTVRHMDKGHHLHFTVVASNRN